MIGKIIYVQRLGDSKFKCSCWYQFPALLFCPLSLKIERFDGKKIFSAETEILPVRTITWPFARRKRPLGCVSNIGLDIDLERFSVMVMIAWRIWNTTENFDENCVIFSGLISLKKISEITEMNLLTMEWFSPVNLLCGWTGFHPRYVAHY